MEKKWRFPLSIDKKIILSSLYRQEIAREVGLPFAQLKLSRQDILTLIDSGLVRHSGKGEDDGFVLTDAGRKQIVVVMAGGAFDILHPGHVETLEKAKKLGDVLVVSVARDKTYERNKGKKPLHSEQQRRQLVGSLRFVDLAILGSETNIFETLNLVKPDIVALGYDQSHSEEKIREEMEKRGLRANVVRLDSSVPNIKSSAIIGQIRNIDQET
jgi:FAD synthetase